MPDVRFKLTIPPDARFIPAVRQIAERVAQCAGYTAAEAAGIASAVARVAEAVVGGPGRAFTNGTGVDIRFEREAGYLDVLLRYPTTESDRRAPEPPGAGDAAARIMDTVEVGREGDIAFCRLRRRLPDEAVDHKCEMPPDQH